jgi:hypothetical protein
MNSKNNNTALIVIAVIAAFGLVMATAVAVLAIVPQAHALRPTCSVTAGQCGDFAKNGQHPPFPTPPITEKSFSDPIFLLLIQ